MRESARDLASAARGACAVLTSYLCGSEGDDRALVAIESHILGGTSRASMWRLEDDCSLAECRHWRGEVHGAVASPFWSDLSAALRGET